MEPLNILVIDEAAQLKECESIIPLQLQGINHAILVGDECQLPATVESKVSYEAGFGRSLFGRLSSLGHQNHFLNIQYRMHPAISYFPNTHFYLNQILDAPNVGRKNYRKKYLPGAMFGPYSFINIFGGREEFDDAGRSRKNMVEVAIVMKIVKNCFKAWLDSKENVSIGIVSPYAAQVVAIQDMLGQKYDKHDGFYVNVKTIDGFQGGEQDIIILSTVRTNGSTLEFISSPQRTNVALTRARHCLWILGNERTLASQENVWKALVLDAKKRLCYFDADEDKELAKSIWDVRKELDQFDDLLNADSVLFRNSIWKVLFSDNFLKSFKKLRSQRTKKSVISLLLKLSSGWRPKRIKVEVLCGNSLQMLKQFKVEGLYVICSTDIEKESTYLQVLKIWDVLPPEDIPKLVRRLDNIFGSYTDDFVSHCSEKYFKGKIEIPVSWDKSIEIIRYKNLDTNVNDAELGLQGDQRFYIENSNVEESLLLMKFYPLSSVVVNHLLSDSGNNELDLPFEVTDEEREIILFRKSTFVLGRSGTGKTTVLTMKLFQNENLHHKSVEAAYATSSAEVPCLNQDYKESSSVNNMPVLRQLFVTVSPKLCQAVKYHVVRLKRYVCQNVEEGFVFSGDTAQTIARGIDFRFQDIKSLFYKKFVLESRRNSYNQGKDKEKISDIFLLNQNFRTHAGVLKLSQSTIELLFRFFPYSIDVLKPETSLIFGEAPVVLECGNKENAIVTIFGNTGHMAGKIVGFGAEQVILVRDDFVRREVLDYVGKQALVLTILECKGLEFQVIS
ncbi:hypothetical protein PIB30_047030 [Stylosanthes scabra]|uniref:Helicase MAGATAMA 3 n=1 Tax=Stylosanthes scabra TaxID=79078 RepID=A0ABU6QG18_9FABA|nr:hypothetical protein [Stylosanthes scabra]